MFNKKPEKERVGALIERLIEKGYRAPHFRFYKFPKDGTATLESYDYGKEAITWKRVGDSIVLGCPKKDCSHNFLQHQGEVWSEPSIFSGIFYRYYGIHLKVSGKATYKEILLMYPNQTQG